MTMDHGDNRRRRSLRPRRRHLNSNLDSSIASHHPADINMNLAAKWKSFVASRVRNAEGNRNQTGSRSQPVLNNTDVPHIKVDPSAEWIRARAFRDSTNLIHVELVEGLEKIETMAFDGCTSLESIIIPSTVNRILYEAFKGCTQLIHVELFGGLEKIEWRAFQGCTSLENMIIPSTVSSIGSCAFKGCTQLSHVELVEGLEKVLNGAFQDCTSLVNVCIPLTVKFIGGDAFENCTSLVAVKFCDEIEEFVSMALLHNWWNHGRSNLSSDIYNHLVLHNIPQRMGAIRMMMWKTQIYAMVQQIPSFAFSSRRLDRHFDLIDSQLSDYESLQADVVPLLMLSLWKSKMPEIGDGYTCGSVNVDDMKLESLDDSESLAFLIVQSVLDFLCVQVNAQHLNGIDSYDEFQSSSESDSDRDESDSDDE